jgi:hypothetical protein
MVLLPLHGSVAGLGYSEELTIQVVLRDSCCVIRDLRQAQATNHAARISLLVSLFLLNSLNKG